MGVTIYGLELFNALGNYFYSGDGSYIGIIMLVLLLGVGVYGLYLVNKWKYMVYRTYLYYPINLIFIVGCLGLIMYVAKFVLYTDIIVSSFFTLIFYSTSIFILTLVLLFMRRYKIKHHILNDIDYLNDILKEKNNIVEEFNDYRHYTFGFADWTRTYKLNDNKLVMEINGKIKTSHQYLTMYAESLIKIDVKKGIDKTKFKALKVFENKNMA